jgi:hypothetical protein
VSWLLPQGGARLPEGLVQPCDNLVPEEGGPLVGGGPPAGRLGKGNVDMSTHDEGSRDREGEGNQLAHEAF